MDTEAFIAAAQVFGGIAGLTFIGLAVHIGRTWGVVTTNVEHITKLATETSTTLIEHKDKVHSWLGKLDMILTGPTGTNGLRGDVADLKELVASHTTDLALINERRTGPKDRRSAPRIVKKGQRRRA